jgi:hypothetical protein
MAKKIPRPLYFLIAAILFLAAMLICIGFFRRIPVAGTTLGLDWFGIRAGVTSLDLNYSADTALRIPPWSALLLVPIGRLPFQAGWGVVAFLTLLVLPLSLERGKKSAGKWIFGALTLVLSYPALRTIADGNVEFLIIGGLLLLEYGLLRGRPLLLALGILLAATKVQEIWILFVFLPWVAGKDWGIRRWAWTIGILALVVLPFIIWKGPEWLVSMATSPYPGSILDSSLFAVLRRLGFPAGVAVFFWSAVLLAAIYTAVKCARGFSREALGFFLAASLLLAPYAAGNNVIVVYAVSVIPLAFAGLWEGIFLAVLINAPFLFLPFRGLQYQWSATYWCLVLLLAWFLFAIRLKKIKIDANSGGKTGKADSVTSEGRKPSEVIPG